MRLNKYIALSTGMSRRAADAVIADGRVLVNGSVPEAGYSVADTDSVTLDKQPLIPAVKATIMLNKPVGYVVSRDGQGSKTIYDLLPDAYQHLKPVGRLDKNSSGLLLLTNDGDLANKLTHPSYQKVKVYEIQLDEPLQPLHRQMISDFGIELEDGLSRLQLDRQKEGSDREWQVTMSEGRNRQIRRTFAALGYDVTLLHRVSFGPWALKNLPPGQVRTIEH